jgi:Cft2 family RNA processing exonuclease
VFALEIQMTSAGLHLPQLGLWLDPRRAQRSEPAFVSHAHSDHTAPHREVILTEATARFMRHRLGGKRVEQILPFAERRHFAAPGGGFHLTLLPAGHIFGSAMSFIEARGESVLYTGDFKLRPGLCAEVCESAPAHGCDTLIMETTFGRPKYRFPPAAEVMAQIMRFCREALDAGATPVLMAYSLGKSQELLRGLAGTGLPVMLEKTIHKITRIHEGLGLTFPAYGLLDLAAAAGKVLLVSPQQARAPWLGEIGPVRTAVATGWALDSSCRYRSGVDAAFPLSDHADFDELIEFVERLRPRRVLTLHGFAADFAATLRELGFDARAISEDEQLTLSLGLKPERRQLPDLLPEA